MLQCPACQTFSVPGWRKFFSRRERFRCPACDVWLRYQTERGPPSRLLSRLRNVWLRTAVIALCLQALLLFFIVAVAYAGCYLRQIPGSAMLSMVLIALVAAIVLSERSILKRQRLTVAERQVGRPSLDGFKDVAMIASSPEGRQMILSSFLLLVLMFGGMTAWRPILVELRKVLPPPACQASVRPGLTYSERPDTAERTCVIDSATLSTNAGSRG